MGDPHCTFCRIISREIPAQLLWEDEQVIAILDINPIQYGHALIIPRHHATDLLELREQDLGAVMRGTQVVAAALVRALNLEGFNVFSNNGRVAGQSVFHFHMHVTPRHTGDGIRFIPQQRTYQNNDMAEIARRIRAAIRPVP